MSKENSLRHFLNILFSECDNELDGSEDPESVVDPAALALLMGVEIAGSARRLEGSESRQRLQLDITDITDAFQLFYVPTQTITSV